MANLDFSAVALAAVMAAAALPAAAQAPPQAMAVDGKFVMQGGEAIYQNLCQACHMADAKGAQGAGIYPALAGNPKLSVAAYPIHVVVKGQRGMPIFGEMLDDQQVADVVGYVRTHFGNSYPSPVTPAMVKAQR
jgi:mono/diheme cytochrome c family protein